MDKCLEELRDELLGESGCSCEFDVLRASLGKLEGMCEAMWSGKVDTKWSPPAGLFKKSGREIANFLMRASKDKKQAMSRLNFYINRAGKNLDKGARKQLSIAKAALSSANEDRELSEELKLRNKGDLAVLKAFAEKKAASSKKFETDGRRLDGNWMGGRGIAEWKGGKVVFFDLGSRSAQTVQRKLKKMIPKFDLGGWGN